MHDSVYTRELAISNKENGYCDLLASIDLSTFRRIPWENNVPFFLVSFFDPKTSASICADPRGVLRKAVDNAATHGMECISGVEFEVRILIVMRCSEWTHENFQYFNFKGAFVKSLI